ncbi:hypothetical protein HDU97_002972 [Phlyctochytrium planicorne]|nr:hypothetical protein HDU97_002972 [Phlyctochytrium planicorne]
MSVINLNFWENFIESLAQIMSRALTDDETEKVLTSFQALHARLRILSSENLRRLEAESAHTRPFCKHKGTCSGNAARGLVKAFGILYAIKYGLSFLPALITGQIYRKPSTLLKIGGKDTISFAAFLSVFISSYKAALCGFRRLRNTSDSWNPFLAGCVAGTSLYLDSNKSRRLMVALYLSTRTMHFVCRWIWQRHIERLVFGRKSEIQLMEDLEEESKPKHRGHNHKHKRHNHPHKPNGSGTLPPPNEIPVAESPKEMSVAVTSKTAREIEVEEDDEKKLDRIKRLRRDVRHAAGTLVMMLSSSQILYAYVCEPQSLAKSYLGFLITHGGVRALMPTSPRDYLETMGITIKAAAASGNARFLPVNDDPSLPPPLFSATVPEGLPVDRISRYADFVSQVPHDYVMCALQHPHTTDCETGIIRAFKGEWWRAMAMYAPLNAIMTAIFKGKDILRHPKKITLQFIKSTLRSTLFLTAYVTMSWCAPCYLRRAFGKESIWMYYVNGLMAGAMVLIEAPGRRLELGMYCLPRALESLWNCGVGYGWWRHVPHGEGIYFCLATGVLMTLYQKDPASIHDGYRKVMYRFFGIN